ncbi:MAG: RNA 2'-phosphotransferase [Proteobacteria bacterium]|nr:RNA 2'-phosphotransferase [Pseudomonadota bacterium]
MGRQNPKLQRQSLSRFLTYVLGVRPDEFGLLADEEGFIPLKELLWALGEVEGWSYVRQSQIDDLLRAPDRTRFEIRDRSIRVAPEQTELPLGPYEAVRPPDLLFHAARRKAYPVILEEGLRPGARPFVLLFPDRDMALRVGRRRDPNPVFLTVRAKSASDQGVVFFRFLETIYLVESLAPSLFTGPPLPKEKEPPEKKARPETPPQPPTPGSFILQPDRRVEPDGRSSKKRKKGDVPDWKRASRKMRREKGG